jgi:hypothetical protein
VKIATVREVAKWIEGLSISTIVQDAAAHFLSSGRLAGGKTMWDIGCIGASILFFVIAIGYAMGCDRLGTKAAQK